MSLISKLCIDVHEAFIKLTSTITQLMQSVEKDNGLACWVADDNHPRTKANAVFSQFQYNDTQAPREIIVCAGFIGSSSETIEMAHQVNHCKDQFKRSMLALKAAKLSKESTMRSETVANALQRMGLGRLHLKQCYRKIPILEGVPKKIRWTWANTRSIKKITVEQAAIMLQKRGSDPGIHVQLQKLASLHEKEPLAIIQELAPHLRANILFTEDSPKNRCMIKGPVPILFPCTLQTPTPDFKPPREKASRKETRLIRSDVKLDPIAYLPAIRAHRYLK